MNATRTKDQTNRMSMDRLEPGLRGRVSRVQVDGLLYRRLLDLGLVVGAKVEALYASPLGDPVVFRVRGANVALRKADAALVEVEMAGQSGQPEMAEPVLTSAHQCGSCLIKRSSTCGNVLSSTEEYLVALAGNPNTGKSTVFNALTGLRQHVGNWPGKTVMRAEGRWKYRDHAFKLVDLPGTYSLLSTSVEEEIARDYILFGNPHCTVVVGDATCLERNLNLVVQILQITDRVVVCVNLVDEAERKGIHVDTKMLEDRLGVPVVSTAARIGRGLPQLERAIHGVACGKIVTQPVQIQYDEALQEAIDTLIPDIEKAFPGIPNPRWIAMRLIDGGDVRLLEEIQSGQLATFSGRVGAASLPLAIAPANKRIRSLE